MRAMGLEPLGGISCAVEIVVDLKATSVVTGASHPYMSFMSLK